MATINTYTDLVHFKVLDVYIDKQQLNIPKLKLGESIGKNNKLPINFGVRLWKKNGENYELVDIDNSSVHVDFHFTRADGKTKKLSSVLEENHTYNPETQQTTLSDSFGYGQITEACTEVAGPFRIAASVGDNSSNLLRTVWIIEGMIADTQAASTFT